MGKRSGGTRRRLDVQDQGAFVGRAIVLRMPTVFPWAHCRAVNLRLERAEQATGRVLPMLMAWTR